MHPVNCPNCKTRVCVSYFTDGNCDKCDNTYEWFDIIMDEENFKSWPILKWEKEGIKEVKV